MTTRNCKFLDRPSHILFWCTTWNSSKINAHRLNETDGYLPFRETGTVERNYDMKSSLSSNFKQSNYQIHSQTMDTTCSNGIQVSEYEDVESGTHNSVRKEENEKRNPENGSTDPYYAMHVPHPNEYYGGQVPVIPELGLISRGEAVRFGNHASDLWSADEKLLGDLLQVYGAVSQEEVKCSDPLISGEPSTMTAREKADISELSVEPSIMTQSSPLRLERSNHLFVPRSRFSDVLAEEGLKKIDSFNRWMSKELGDDILLPQSTPGTFWATTDGDATFQSSDPSREQDNNYMLDPLISQEQLFSITDISPSWTYVGSVIQVLITGRLLKRLKEAEVFQWSCMFGEVEVPAEVIADGVLHCCAPMHEEGRVPFYITCSNRLACSEIREFEYRGKKSYGDGGSSDNGNAVDRLNSRFAKLLCLDTPCSADVDLADQSENTELSRNIDSLINEDCGGWDDLLMLDANELSPEIPKERACQNLLKQKLCEWLIRKSAEGGKGASVLDEGGQGVLHLASALGYDWALQQTVMAGGRDSGFSHLPWCIPWSIDESLFCTS
ncbi:hypothetical protein MLD38_031299 [Melastoma candidum]|uniref:Uncharacterized protein n=1 Tax=Melastoma candidum TaxID=119954 RepID=A0ACB9MQG8_9MYRT|nr:hypothetical protein MLD38_031299 [Melastoma candidum]